MAERHPTIKKILDSGFAPEASKVRHRHEFTTPEVARLVIMNVRCGIFVIEANPSQGVGGIFTFDVQRRDSFPTIDRNGGTLMADFGIWPSHSRDTSIELVVVVPASVEVELANGRYELLTTGSRVRVARTRSATVTKLTF